MSVFLPPRAQGTQRTATTDFTDFHGFRKPQKGVKGVFTTKDLKGRKPPQADWLYQDLQDGPFGRFRAGGISAVVGRFAGVALQLPVAQSWLCPLEASFFGLNLL